MKSQAYVTSYRQEKQAWFIFIFLGLIFNRGSLGRQGFGDIYTAHSLK